MIYYAENTLNKQNTYKNAARHAGRSGRQSPYWLVWLVHLDRPIFNQVFRLKLFVTPWATQDGS